MQIGVCQTFNAEIFYLCDISNTRSSKHKWAIQALYSMPSKHSNADEIWQFNSLCPRKATQWYRSGSTLTKVNQWWLMISSTNFNKMSIKAHKFSVKQMHLKMSSAKCQVILFMHQSVNPTDTDLVVTKRCLSHTEITQTYRRFFSLEIFLIKNLQVEKSSICLCDFHMMSKKAIYHSNRLASHPEWGHRAPGVEWATPLEITIMSDAVCRRHWNPSVNSKYDWL